VSEGTRVVVLCTGNAARSVMVGALLEETRPDIRVETAGTHVVEGQPVSWRTREALEAVGVNADAHRSCQLREDRLEEAGVVLAMATEHAAWIRRQHPEVAGRTGTIRRLARDLPADDRSFAERLTGLGLAEVDLEPWEDVADPAGGEVDDYVACARELDRLVRELAPRL